MENETHKILLHTIIVPKLVLLYQISAPVIFPEDKLLALPPETNILFTHVTHITKIGTQSRAKQGQSSSCRYGALRKLRDTLRASSLRNFSYLEKIF